MDAETKKGGKMDETKQVAKTNDYRDVNPAMLVFLIQAPCSKTHNCALLQMYLAKCADFT